MSTAKGMNVIMVRKAVMEDLRDIMEIIKQAIVEMATYNNTQWDESYPHEKDFMNDIQRGDLFVTEQEGKLAGFICINKVEPAEYNGLNWSLNKHCIVVHRMAVNSIYRRSGIGTKLMKFADKLALENNIGYLKTDTYSINMKMNALFKKCGYEFVGEMSFLEREKPFYCYEKILNKEK
ncbi:GNAT family N-acetyltransferase [Clostridium sp. BJN0013]|uniref:GNAT family N-acetyltransferase n=1 Tax=Clostridium sp. BJN0013 TaxID=3236840 RepID=UPI0034C6713A